MVLPVICRDCGFSFKGPHHHEPDHTAIARHFDEGKVRMELVPYDAINVIARAFGYGATKYGDYNYLKGMLWLKLFGSTLRHLFKWSVGEDIDKESGLPHLGHAACDILMLIVYAERKLGTDNRAKATK